MFTLLSDNLTLLSFPLTRIIPLVVLWSASIIHYFLIGVTGFTTPDGANLFKERRARFHEMGLNLRDSSQSMDPCCPRTG